MSKPSSCAQPRPHPPESIPEEPSAALSSSNERPAPKLASQLTREREGKEEEEEGEGEEEEEQESEEEDEESNTRDLSSLARLNSDGRLDIDLSGDTELTDLPKSYALDVLEEGVELERTELEGRARFGGVPAMSVLICIVGSRGDVQPYIALSLALVAQGHRVRLATHGEFKELVESATKGRVEFYDLGGDPRLLMKFMTSNPGLIPGYESLTNGDIGRNKKMLKEIMRGCYLASFSPDVATGRDFAADALISNPPAFAHIHLAEALGLPLQMTFTMPWSASTDFHHPLVSVTGSDKPKGITNYLSFSLFDMVTWQGLSGIINSFRKKTLGLRQLSINSGPSVLDRLKVPWTYCWSGSLIPKPSDWKQNTDIAGFYFLNLSSDYEPPPELAAFLAAGPPPIYIGFGSVPVPDPQAMSKTIFDAVKSSGVRALVSAGWGGLGGEEVPEGVFILGNVPHDWLFTKVFAVCHHGGAGTTAIGLLNGLPTIVVPFFGDQQFWGEMVAKAGGGPAPIPSKELTAERLADAILFCKTEEAQTAATKMGDQIRVENGVASGVESFYRHLPLTRMRCEIDPSRIAVWWSTDLCLRLSAFAAQTLVDANLLRIDPLELHRAKEYDTSMVYKRPISRVSAAIGLTPTKAPIKTDNVRRKGPLAILSTGIKVVGPIRNGIRAYKGISGLVKQGRLGSQQDGAKGAMKAVGNGLLDAIPRTLTRNYGGSAGEAQSCQLAAINRSTRIVEGLEAFNASSEEDRCRIVETFALACKQTAERRLEYQMWTTRVWSKMSGGGSGKEKGRVEKEMEEESEKKEGDSGEGK